MVNRRTLVWLALTAAVVFLIKINEGRQGVPLAEHRDRELARRRPRVTPQVHGPLPPSGIGAAPDHAPRPVSKTAAPAEAETRSGVGRRRQGRIAAQADCGGLVRAERGRRKGPTWRASAVAGPSGATRRQSRRQIGRKEEKDEAPLMVHCDISPQAAKSEAFDKLLDANGVVWRQEGRRGDSPQEAEKKETNAEGEVFVYAQATPAQLKAVLAGLAAKPEMFIAVSVKPEQEKTPRKVGHAPVVPQAPGAAAAARGRCGRDGFAAEEPSPMPQQPQRRQLAESVPRQRIIFVLRMVEGDRPATAAKTAEVTIYAVVGRIS